MIRARRATFGWSRQSGRVSGGLDGEHRVYKCHEPVDGKDNDTPQHSRQVCSDKKTPGRGKRVTCWTLLTNAPSYAKHGEARRRVSGKEFGGLIHHDYFCLI